MNSKREFVVKFSFFYSIKDELLSIKQKKKIINKRNIAKSKKKKKSLLSNNKSSKATQKNLSKIFYLSEEI